MDVWDVAGDPHRDQVIQERAEGKLGLPPGAMTKPASR